MFKIPDLTYPLKIGTIGTTIATNHEISANCNTCHHHARINLVQLSYRLGMDHSTRGEDLKPYLYCKECRAAGRPDKNISLILHSPTDPYSEWPQRQRNPNPYARAKGE